jgi:DNA adenine methylase
MTPIEPAVAAKKSGGFYDSPLRFPGSRRRLAPFISGMIRQALPDKPILCEPMVGGGSVFLRALAEDSVSSVVLGDIDPNVVAFWRTTFDDTAWLVAQIGQVEISTDQWAKLYSSKPTTRRDRALTFLFLNRTSYGGLVGTRCGPLGGWTQRSPHKINCRFNRETIIRRLLKAAHYRDRVELVHRADWQRTLERATGVAAGRPLVTYLDPPFLTNGHKLYRHHFDVGQHERLLRWAASVATPFILSNDTHPAVTRLYTKAGFEPLCIGLSYTSSKWRNQREVQELIYTNLSPVVRPS